MSVRFIEFKDTTSASTDQGSEDQGTGGIRVFERRWPDFLGGWSAAGIIVARTGATFNVTLGSDVNDDGAFDDRPALGTGSLDSLYNPGGDKTQFLVSQDQAARLLAVPADVTNPFDAVRRNSFRAPTILNYGLADQAVPPAGRDAARRRGQRLQYFQQRQVRAPVSTLSSAFFGRIQGTAAQFRPRQIQVGMKLTF
jgi:hypothetical protein